MAKVLMVVNNAGYGDWRVVKQAEEFVRKGWDCTVLGLQKPGIPTEEVVAGVRYVRVPYKRNFLSLIFGVFPFFAKILPSHSHFGASGSVGRSKDVLVIPCEVSGRQKFTFFQKIRRVFFAALSLVERKLISYIGTLESLHPLFVRMTFGGYVRSFLPAIQSLDFDIIQSHEIWALESCVLGCRGRPVIYDSHELETHRNLPWPKRSRQILASFERKYIKAVSLVVAVSPSCAKYLRRLYRLQSVGVVRNLPLSGWLTKSPRTIRDALSLDENTPLLIYTGNVTLNRGVESVLDALQHLDGVHFACVGSCNAGVRASLERQISELGIAGRIHFLPPVAPGCLPHFISSGNLAMLPVVPACLSYRFCLPNKLFEAIHSNLFVLTNSLPDVKRVILDDGLGAVCDFSDPVETANAIRKALSGPKLDNRSLLSAFSFETEFESFFEACKNLCA